MWRILKSEIQNHWLGFIFYITSFLILAIYVFTSGWESVETDIPGLSSSMFIPAGLLIFLRLNRMVREKTDRLIIMLPFSLWRIGLIRILFGIIIWLTLVLIFMFGLLIFRFEVFNFSILWYLISLTGTFFAANSLILFYRDLTYCFTGKYQRVIITIIYVVFVTLAINLFSLSALERYLPITPVQALIPLKTHLAQFSSSFIGAFMTLLASLLTVFGEIWIFTRRRFYLE